MEMVSRQCINNSEFYKQDCNLEVQVCEPLDGKSKIAVEAIRGDKVVLQEYVE